MNSVCIYNPGACMQAVADAVAPLLRYIPFVTTMSTSAAATAAGPALAVTTPFMLCGDSSGCGAAEVLRIDPTKPARDVLPGSLHREFPGEHMDKSLDQVRDLLKGAKGREKQTLQKAKKLLEQADRLLGKNKG